MSHLLTYRHLREIKSVQGKYDYQKKEKESNEADLIIIAHALSLSPEHTTLQAERLGAQKNIEKNDASLKF